MLIIADTEISVKEKEGAVSLLGSVMNSVGDHRSGAVIAMDMHRLISLLAAAVLETDVGLSSTEHFAIAGNYLGELIASCAAKLRMEREQGGVGLIDQAIYRDHERWLGEIDCPVLLDGYLLS